MKLKYSNGQKIIVENMSCKQQLYEMRYQCKDKVIKVSKAEINGIQYRKGLFVAIDSGIKENSTVTFGCIKEVIIINTNEVWLWCQEWQCLGYSEPLNAYVVSDNTDSY